MVVIGRKMNPDGTFEPLTQRQKDFLKRKEEVRKHNEERRRQGLKPDLGMIQGLSKLTTRPGEKKLYGFYGENVTKTDYKPSNTGSAKQQITKRLNKRAGYYGESFSYQQKKETTNIRKKNIRKIKPVKTPNSERILRSILFR